MRIIKGSGGFAILIQQRLAGAPCTISLTDAAITLSEGDNHVAAWDRGGRLYSVADDERTCRRGLSGRVLMKWRSAGRLERAWATQAEADATIDGAAALASRLLEGVTAPATADSPPRDVVAALARAARFDSRTAREDARRFDRVYRTVGILPPDQYLALVLQATEGCSFRSCTFCDFYRNPYRVRSEREFRDHVRDVRDYLGDSMSLRRRTIFLGSANALAVPLGRLLPLFDILAGEFGPRPVYAFVDAFTGTLKTTEDYRRLAEGGLRRVYIGLESGDDALLAIVKKPASSAQAVATVRALKAAGVAAGVIVMLGLGGDRFADSHVQQTAQVLSAMHLDAGDLLYFSQLVDQPGSAYAGSMAEHGVRGLSNAECAAQRKVIEAALSFPGGGPKMATYDIREFVY